MPRSAGPLSYRRRRPGRVTPLAPVFAVSAASCSAGRRGNARSGGGPLGWSVAVALLLLLAATLLAPEGAADQAAICQRHNGVDACRVW